MANIAAQVATLESDLDAALAEIDQLKAANAAFDSANASLRRENVALQLEINDMKHYVDDTRAMVEKLASSALELLRASRRHVGPPPAAETPRVRTDQITDSDVAEIKRRGPGAIVGGLDAKIAALPEKWPAQKAVAEVMASDSGDEHVTYNNFTPEMQKALEADREKLLQMTGRDHGPMPLEDYLDDRDRHMTAAEIATIEQQIEEQDTERHDPPLFLASKSPGNGQRPIFA